MPEELLRVFLSSLLSVAYLFFIARLLGHRQIVQLSVFDYINGISIGSVAANLAIEPDRWAEHLVALTVFGGVTLLFSVLTDKSVKFRRFATGKPTVLLCHGVMYDENFKKAKIDLDEFLTLCREAGYFDPAKIDTAVLEFNGALSILPKIAERPATVSDLSLTPNSEETASAVVADGKILQDNLSLLGKDTAWLTSELSARGYGDVPSLFLATVTEKGTLTVYPRGGERTKTRYAL